MAKNPRIPVGIPDPHWGWGSSIPIGDGDGDVNRFPDGDKDGDGDEAEKRGWGRTYLGEVTIPVLWIHLQPWHVFGPVPTFAYLSAIFHCLRAFANAFARFQNAKCF
ncbi:hypothetical protein Tco_1434339 [Tanacetum coccineum]